MLQRIREWLSLVLIVLLPFHALAITILTKLIAGPGHAPFFALALWKEVVLGGVLLMAIVEFLINVKCKMKNEKWWRFDLLDALIFFLILLSVFLSILHSTFYILHFALGFRYDFLPLIAFIILRRVPWSDLFWERCRTGILIVAGILSIYGIATLFLPDGFFTWLGYSSLHSLYVPTGPLAAFQQIGGAALHRVQSTFSGPNQFGIWLLIPIALASVTLSSSKSRHVSWFDGLPTSPSGLRRAGTMTLCLVVLFLTFSRAAWLGAFFILLISLYPLIKPYVTRTRVLISTFICASLLFIALALFPNTLLRISSTRGHIDRPIEAIQKMIEHPLGLGLGSAGPATNRSSDTCVMLRPEDDPSWAKSHADLCVFLGDRQVQPVDRTCNCPFLPENWYLQIGVELGWVGFFLYLCLVGIVLVRLRECKMQNVKCKMEESSFFDKKDIQPSFYILHSTFYIFAGVSIAALFLHAWEDAAVAYTAWILVAARLAVRLLSVADKR